MTTQHDFVVRLKIDVSGFQRALWDATESMRGLGTARGLRRPPRKPYPRTFSNMTARQYRAARRAYAREMAAYRKATK